MAPDRRDIDSDQIYVGNGAETVARRCAAARWQLDAAAQYIAFIIADSATLAFGVAGRDLWLTPMHTSKDFHCAGAQSGIAAEIQSSHLAAMTECTEKRLPFGSLLVTVNAELVVRYDQSSQIMAGGCFDDLCEASKASSRQTVACQI